MAQNARPMSNGGNPGIFCARKLTKKPEGLKLKKQAD
jgi:hypothetical protein